jgi:hydrogenase nickel incorporation protein HypA/HybF
MHELSIVLNIIHIAESEAVKAGAVAVKRIELDIGKLSTVEPMAFDFAWKQAVRSTMLEHAERVTNYISGKGRCTECGAVFGMNELYDPCPACGSYLSEVIEGRELQVKSMNIDS